MEDLTWTLTVRVTTESPLLVAAAFATGATRRTARFIPGSALRGALASVLLAECDQSDTTRQDHSRCPEDRRDRCDFYRVFLSEETRPPVFGNCYPEGAWPAPASAVYCPAHAASANDAGREEGHVVFDTLIPLLAFEEALDTQGYPGYVYSPTCRCGQRARPFRGFWSMEDPAKPVRISTQRVSKVAINRARAVAEDGLLYSQEVLPEGLTLVGRIIAAPDTSEILVRRIPQVTALGGSRSRGTGRVRLTCSRANGASFPDLGARLRRFNEELRRHRAALGNLRPDERELCFAVDLVSDAILTDSAGCPTLQLVPSAFAVASERLSATARLKRSVSSGRVVGSWNDAARLPRDTVLATNMGSVFVYSVAIGGGGYETEDDLLQDLQALESGSVGAERERGFGEIIVCSPFHLGGDTA